MAIFLVRSDSMNVVRQSLFVSKRKIKNKKTFPKIKTTVQIFAEIVDFYRR